MMWTINAGDEILCLTYSGWQVAKLLANRMNRGLTTEFVSIPDGPYSYSAIRGGKRPIHYRVQDQNDDRMATCLTEEKAKLVTRLLNYGSYWNERRRIVEH